MPVKSQPVFAPVKSRPAFMPVQVAAQAPFLRSSWTAGQCCACRPGVRPADAARGRGRALRRRQLSLPLPPVDGPATDRVALRFTPTTRGEFGGGFPLEVDGRRFNPPPRGEFARVFPRNPCCPIGSPPTRVGKFGRHQRLLWSWRFTPTTVGNRCRSLWPCRPLPFTPHAWGIRASRSKRLER